MGNRPNAARDGGGPGVPRIAAILQTTLEFEAMGTILAVFLHFMDPIDYAGGFRGFAIEEGVKGGIGLVGACWAGF